MTDYTEVELGSNEVAEESADRSVEVRAGSSSAMEVFSNQPAVDEEDAITVSQHVELLPKDPESNRNSEEDRSLCEKSTQCDIRDGGAFASLTELRTTGTDSSVSTMAEGTGSDGEGKNKDLKLRKKDATHSSVFQEEHGGESKTTVDTDNSSPLASKDQAVPVRRGRGRPRKNAGAPAVVKNGRRGRLLKAGSVPEER